MSEPQIEYEQGKVGKLDREVGDLHIEVTAYGGATVQKAIVQMVALAQRLDVDVWCYLNGVRTLARPTDNADSLYAQWERSLNQPYIKYRMAST